jgi:hypothetical protein
MRFFRSDKINEAEFQQYYFDDNIQVLRLTLFIAAPLYMLFGFWDYMLAPELISTTWAIRGIVVMCLVGLLILSYTGSFFAYYKPLVAAVSLLAAMGITSILVILPEGEMLGVSGVLLVILFLTIFNILFFWTLICGFSIVVGFTLYTVMLSDIDLVIIFSANFFLFSGAFLVAAAAYQTERLSRLTFQLASEREAEKQERIDWLANMAGFLRHELSRRMTTRTTPQLHFFYDESIENGEHLSSLIDSAVAADKSKSDDSDV